MKTAYQQAPGRGLMSSTAHELRMKYLSSLAENINSELDSKSIQLKHVQNNIESFIGTIEIPLGLVGPLRFQTDDEHYEWVHSAVATTEGALVASMNRGAKAISQCGGFKAHIVHQKMLRTPMFTFESMSESMKFVEWIRSHFDQIKAITKQHSNFAELLEISPVIVGKIAHLKFIYSTSDASGQNMTTACTWNACLWIEKQFQIDNSIEIQHFVIDGNGASDKKVSFYSMQNGRGTHVISECFLSNEIIEKTLRTTADDMFRSYNHSMAISRIDGMIGYNINVANAIAGIFGSTGQDLACIHESSTGILQMEQSDEGLYLSLSLPSLVVGTVGGGTHLPGASKILELMDCKGAGKSQRFSKLIAGFALSIEVSTLAAIVSGQFARAHQKLGRNKPIKWLLKSELDLKFFQKHLQLPSPIKNINFPEEERIDNGIIMDLTQKVSKKLIGFVELDVALENNELLGVLCKSKALGAEVIDGLRFMASNLNSSLADCLAAHSKNLEYSNCHLKEIEMYEALKSLNIGCSPSYFGSLREKEREIFLFFMERLNEEEMQLFNSENSPEQWTKSDVEKAIYAIHEIHTAFSDKKNQQRLASVKEVDYHKSVDLYSQFIALNRKDYDYLDMDEDFTYLDQLLQKWAIKKPEKIGGMTVVHNDFNPRNAGIRKSGEFCIYDWELAAIDLPQRDVFEFLTFTSEEDFKEAEWKAYLELHYKLVLDFNPKNYSWLEYLHDLQTSAEEFLITRINFYLAGSTLVNYPFIPRVFKNACRMLRIINSWKAE